MHFNNNSTPQPPSIHFHLPAANLQFVSHLHFDGFILWYPGCATDDLQYATDSMANKRGVQLLKFVTQLLAISGRKKFFNHDTRLNQAFSFSTTTKLFNALQHIFFRSASASASPFRPSLIVPLLAKFLAFPSLTITFFAMHKFKVI